MRRIANQIARRRLCFLFVVVLCGVAAPASAAVKIRVACLGDSITKGAGAGKGESYPDQLGKLLGDRYDVRNFGVNGATLLRNGDNPYARRKELAAALAFRPNIVILLLGANDSKPKNWRHKDQFAADLRAMVQPLKALPSAPHVLLGRPINVARDNFGIRDQVVKNEIRPLVEQVAREENLQVIDFAAALADKPDLLPDGVHPNGAGYARLAAAARTALEEKAPAVKP